MTNKQKARLNGPMVRAWILHIGVVGLNSQTTTAVTKIVFIRKLILGGMAHVIKKCPSCVKSLIRHNLNLVA